MQINDETIMSTLKAVVAENPDHVYERPADITTSGEKCLYVHGDVPGCVVGHVLHRLGVPLGGLRAREGGTASALLNEFASDVSTKTAFFLDDVQGHQDGGEKWGSALAKAANEHRMDL